MFVMVNRVYWYKEIIIDMIDWYKINILYMKA